MENPLVLELQRLSRTSAISIGELLRYAKSAAVKLDLQDAQIWIDHELNGYEPPAQPPPYRVIPSELELKNPFHGWNPVGWDGRGNVQQHFASTEVRLPIGEVEAAAQLKHPGFGLHQTESDLISALDPDWGRLPARRSVSQVSLVGILEAVRAKVLDWSLALEKHGVLGREMTFSEREKEEAIKVALRLDGIASRVLFLSANPDPKSPLNVEQEHSRIVKVRNGSKFQSKIAIESLPDLDLPEFAKSLRLHSPTVVHFSGHGGEDGSTLMRDENNNAARMAPRGIAKLLALQKSTIQLVVLNACYSSALADLIAEDIDCVVGMSDAVSDAAAILFAQTFYSALFDGSSVADAFAVSAASVEARYSSEKDTPVLKTRHGVNAHNFNLIA